MSGVTAIMSAGIGCDQVGLSRADRIRELNDTFRMTLEGGKVMLSRGVASLPANLQVSLIAAVRFLADFPPGNDPYEEHDFGAVDVHGERYFWKIDYYDLDLQYGSPDPADPAFTIRVMTIMRADEY